MAERKIVVVGAGVAGLTTALLLSKNKNYQIVVAAKHMPGDYDIEYASPWAGANYMRMFLYSTPWKRHADGEAAVSIRGTPAAAWDRNTWPVLEDLARNHPESGIHFQKTEIYNRKKDIGSTTASWLADLLSPNPWWRELFSDFHEIPREKLKPGIDNGSAFTSVCINTSIYLPWLVSQCLRAGVVFKRAIFKHISEAADFGHQGQKAALVVNCTGLSASKLGGVEDKTVIPARGQIILVRNDPGAMFAISGTDDADDEVSYIMKRAAGGGTILGGSYQKGNWESQFDPNLATRIMKRCVALCPQLTGGKGIEHLDIIRHCVGLRPLRIGGARIEKEKIGGIWVVHNYGHGGFGYQASYGCSQEVVKLVDDALKVKERL